MIWIRITKSGGESMNDFLKSSNLKQDVLIVTPCIHNGQYLLFKQKYEKTGKAFSIIRNPYDKALSAYKWLVKNPQGNRRCKDIFDPNISFTDFTKKTHILRSKFDQVRNVCVTLDHGEFGTNHYQEYWVVSHLESCFDSINFFIDPSKVELISLEKMQEFSKTLITGDKKFPHKNVSSSDKTLSATERSLVENIYEKDFELYERAKEWKS
jgi:hypothetical protein